MLIEYKHIDENFEYDGSQISPSWAFKAFGIKGSTIISWQGPMNIRPTNLKDFADVGLEIKSNNMIHFMIEHFDCQPANIRMAYHRQRLFVLIVKEELAKRAVKTTRDGDDIYFNGFKLSVSIASISPTSMKIHFAMNLKDEGTPDDVETVGLYELKDTTGNLVFDESNLRDLEKAVVTNYITELTTIEGDISKTDSL